MMTMIEMIGNDLELGVFCTWHLQELFQNQLFKLKVTEQNLKGSIINHQEGNWNLVYYVLDRGSNWKL